MFKPIRFLFAFPTLVMALGGAAAQADCISISNLPYTITQSGSYCVTADLSTDLPSNGAAISIFASNVDLDFQGHSIKNISTTTAYGAYGVQFPSGGLTDVTVHNGTLSGFFIGIGSHTDIPVSNLTIDQMTILSSTFGGIGVSGPNVRITNNKIYNTLGTYQAFGISAGGTFGVQGLSASNRAVIQGNVISSTYANSTIQAYATGISADSFIDLQIRDNSISNTRVKKGVADSSIVAINITQTLSLCDAIAPCNSLLGGLIVQDNNIVNAGLIARVSSTNSTGIKIRFPADHAIVTGSKITLMDTGIDAENAHTAWPNTPPVLLLNNVITGASTSIKGGVTLPQ